MAAQSFWLAGACAAAATSVGCAAIKRLGKTLRRPRATMRRTLAPVQIRSGVGLED
jgi:hypothetical protein